MARRKRPTVRRPAGRRPAARPKGLAARFGLVKAKGGVKKLGGKIGKSRAGRGSKAVGRGVKAVGRAIRDFGRGAMGPRTTAKPAPRKGKKRGGFSIGRRGAATKPAMSKRPAAKVAKGAKKAPAIRRPPVAARKSAAPAKKITPTRGRSVAKPGRRSPGRKIGRATGRRSFNAAAHPRASNGRFRKK